MSTVEATYFTTSDRYFFPGTVALINSLRLTGHAGEVVAFDLGLTDRQRQRLSTIATVEAPVIPPHAFPKALPSPEQANGTIVLVDSDILVVASLDPLLEAARDGQICVFPDPDDRWFEQWRAGFALRSPLRRERFVNAGFIAFSAEHWPWFLDRWRELLGLIPPERLARQDRDPFADTEQDALNALLMSEVPAGAVSLQPDSAQAHPAELSRVRVLNARTLTCTDEGREVVTLHQLLMPKSWSWSGWRRDVRHAYARLLPRVLCSDDVPLRLAPDELPVWFRPSRVGKLALRALTLAHSAPGLDFAARVRARVKRDLRSTRERMRNLRKRAPR